MNNVVQFPKPKLPKRKHKQVVSVREMYAQGNSYPDQMVWDMCRYTRRNQEDYPDCMECSRWENDKHYGKMKRGCFGMAQEACRYAMAWVERINHKGPYK